MAVHPLSFAEPFFTIDYVVREAQYPWHRYRSKSRCIFLAVSIAEQA